MNTFKLSFVTEAIDLLNDLWMDEITFQGNSKVYGSRSFWFDVYKVTVSVIVESGNVTRLQIATQTTCFFSDYLPSTVVDFTSLYTFVTEQYNLFMDGKL